MRRHLGDAHVVMTDVTAGEAVLAIMGPEAREFLGLVSPSDLSNEHHPFGMAREIEIGMGLARAHRVSYVGELGWELYVSSDMAAHVAETIVGKTSAKRLQMVGLHAMDSLRIEKAFRHFGHDISCEDHVIDAGLGFAVKTAKPDFIGRDAVLRRKETGPKSRMMQFLLKDAEPLLYHNEPILRDSEVVGYLSSGNYGHWLGGAVGMGYVPCEGQTPDEVLASSYQIEVAGTLVDAEASLRPMYDPKSEKVRG